jgi:hypothetical protein
MKDAILYGLIVSLFLAWGIQTVRFNRLDAVRDERQAVQAGIMNGTVINIQGKRVIGIHVETMPEEVEGGN